MDKQTVVVLFGGRSSEHSISSATAGGVLGAIDRDRYAVIPVGITREGAFVLEDDDPAKFPLDAAHLPEVADNGSRVLWPEPGGSLSDIEIAGAHLIHQRRQLRIAKALPPILGRPDRGVCGAALFECGRDIARGELRSRCVFAAIQQKRGDSR